MSIFSSGVRNTSAAVAVCCAIVAGCASPPPPAAKPAGAPAIPAAAPVDTLGESFAALTATIPAAVGVAVASEGGTRLFGNWSAGPAWSTIKVPLSIAALRSEPERAGALVNKAIVQSDNAAAEQLWSMLGDPAAASHAVEAILRDGKDTVTVVQSQRVREGYSAFGQTDWAMQAQAGFAARLPCLAGAGPVLDDMHRLAADQQWGLAGVDGVAAKGGWGPGVDGAYLVRQLATVSSPSGTFGVALAAQSDGGTYDAAIAAINQLGGWVKQHRNEFPAMPC
ncbi:hypothetical protein [Mycobacterium sp. 852013-50091_SCH5140682]|uniref:hypothetical protein n=1 Tax=Mycobacterium sp. 852013-50091_SCH5140682 TaxID=1834109 RepID=UPI001E478553|nr:hypothetical protein [Mycobacterium sp. 852013-50091_SCH5140682]